MVNRTTVRILIDTGADINLIAKNYVKNKNINHKSKMVFQGVGGSETCTFGRANINVVLDGVVCNDDFEVVDKKILGEHDVFLGIGFICKFHLILDFFNMKVYNHDICIDMIPPSKYKKAWKVKTIPSNKYSSQVSEPEITTKTIPINNNNSSQFSEPEITVCRRVEEKVEDEEIIFKLDHLPDHMSAPVKCVLEKYPNVFTPLAEDEFPSLQFDSLQLTDNKPVQSKIYRFPEIHKDLVKKEMEKLLKLKVISHSKSHFNSPVWVVSKKDDEKGNPQFRVVIDYRSLNKITIPDRFPLPNIADIIDQLGKAKYFSVLDLVSGFHQIEIKPEDRYKTAFTVGGNLYEFNRLPFGLINSAPAFQRIMIIVLGDLVGIACFVYIDDIVIYGKTLEEHNINLDLVLERLSIHKLKVKPGKCHFLQTEISYLGYVISEAGVKMDPKKTEAIKNLKTPTTEKEVRSFLGMVGFYRKFIPDFAKVAEPLHKLLRKDTLFEWSSECDLAFKKLIDIMSVDIVLQFPNFDETFFLTCDASNSGLGSVLSQKDEEGRDKPISFISRALNTHERNYNTTEKECLAIVWSVDKFNHYLYGRRFNILSDHKPLVWLDSVEDPGAKLLRWRLKLNNYNYKIDYTPGKTNYVADELSRNNYRDLLDRYSDEKIIPSVFNINANDDSDDEDEDEEDNDEEEEVETTDFVPRKNRKTLTNLNDVYKLIMEQHCGPIGGHRGIKATTNVIKIYYDIKGLKKKVTDVISRCEVCQRCKIDRQNRKLPLTHTVTSSEPNEKIAFDIIGPFRYPDGRKLYGLTIQDDFSKYILFVGIKDCTAQTVARAVIDNWILYFGIPKILLSDNGSNLCGDIMTNVANFFNIQRVTTSIAHPQSNGGVERAHARLAEFIRATDDELEKGLDWETRLKVASNCYNNTVHATTGYSPFYLMFGRHPRLITALDNPEDILKDTYLEVFHKNLKEIWSIAKRRIDQMKEREIKRDNDKTKRRLVVEYKVDDQVWVRTEALHGKVNRMEPPWKGPLVVVNVRENNLDVRRFRKNYSGINKADVKLFVPGAPPPWVTGTSG